MLANLFLAFKCVTGLQKTPERASTMIFVVSQGFLAILISTVTVLWFAA